MSLSREVAPREPAVVVRPGEHACCRFAAPEDRLRITLDVVRDGVQRGDRVLYVCDRDDVEVFMSELAALDDAVGPALERGQLEVRSSAETYAPDGRFELERMLAAWCEERDRGHAEGYEGMTITGELGEAFCAAGGMATVEEYERRLDELELPATIRLCQYDHASLGGEAASAVACSHDVDLAPELAAIGREGVLAAGRLRSGALRLAGEVDLECAPALAGVVGADALEPVPLDLADVSFVDVSGMRALRGGAIRPLAIIGASAPVSRLLALLAWDTDPAVEIVEPA